MAEYASKGLSNGIGIPALVLGSLGFLQSGGLANGLFGNNAQQDKVMALMTENAQLKAQSYTDNKTCALQAEVADLRAQVQCINTQAPLRDELMNERIARAADLANCGIGRVQDALACLAQRVDAVTSFYVPVTNVMPTPAVAGASAASTSTASTGA